MQRSRRITAILLASAVSLGVALAVFVSTAQAAAPWTGKIGRIDMRTGYADTYLGTAHSQHDIVIRSSSSTSGNIVCIIEEGTGFIEHFLSIATAAMLAGLDVTIERHGSAQGQFKCSWISVAR